MLIFILVDVQYSQNAVFTFEKGSNRQNHFSSSSHHLVKKFPPVKFSILPQPLACNCLKAIQSHYEETVYFLPEIPGTH